MNKKTIANLIDYVKRTSWLKIVLVFIISLSSTVASAKKFEFSMRLTKDGECYDNFKIVVDTDASTVELLSELLIKPFRSRRYKYFKRYGKDNGANRDVLVFSEDPLPPTYTSEMVGVLFLESHPDDITIYWIVDDGFWMYRPVSMTEYSKTFAALKSFLQQNSTEHTSRHNQTNENRPRTDGSGKQSKHIEKQKSIEFERILYVMLDERGINTPSDFNIYNHVQMTINNAKGKRIWVEFRYYDADNMSALSSYSSQYRTINEGAGLVKSFIADSDSFYNDTWDPLPLSALGLGNGKWNILVIPYIYIGDYDPNASSTVIGPRKILHFTKYGENVSEMTVSDQ